MKTAAISPPLIAPDALPFQEDLARLIAERPPRLLRLWPFFSAALLVALIGAAAVLPVDVVVTAPGRLAADAPAIVLKPLTRAVLRDLLVRPGDRVRAGQVLAHLDPTLPEADLAALSAEAGALRAEIARRSAAAAGEMVADAPVWGESAPPTDALLSRRNEETAARRAALSTREDGLLAEESLARQGLAQAEAARDLAAELETRRAALSASGALREMDALSARQARLAAESALTAARTRAAELAAAIAATRAERILLDASLRRESAEALPALRLRLTQVEEAIDKTRRIADLSTLTAPRDGTVISIAPGGPGAVMAEGEAILALIPSDAALIADVDIPSADVGRLMPGDAVALKIDAYPWRRIGAGAGRLISLAPATRQQPGDAAPSHPARVSLDRAPEFLPPGAALTPGLTLTAEVHIGTRTLLDYFLDPLLRGLNESLREP